MAVGRQRSALGQALPAGTPREGNVHALPGLQAAKISDGAGWTESGLIRRCISPARACVASGMTPSQPAALPGSQAPQALTRLGAALVAERVVVAALGHVSIVVIVVVVGPVGLRQEGGHTSEGELLAERRWASDCACFSSGQAVHQHSSLHSSCCCCCRKHCTASASLARHHLPAAQVTAHAVQVSTAQHSTVTPPSRQGAWGPHLVGVHPVGVLLVAPVVLLVLRLVPPLGVVAGAVVGALLGGRLGLSEVAHLAHKRRRGARSMNQISRQRV